MKATDILKRFAEIDENRTKYCEDGTPHRHLDVTMYYAGDGNKHSFAVQIWRLHTDDREAVYEEVFEWSGD